jgi:hypothetical protein
VWRSLLKGKMTELSACFSGRSLHYHAFLQKAMRGIMQAHGHASQAKLALQAVKTGGRCRFPDI